MRTTYTIIFKDNGQLTTPGVSFGYGSNHLTVIEIKEPYLIIKKQGAQDWSGRGESSYYPTEYWLCRRRKKDAQRVYRVEILFEITPGRKWKKALSILKKALHEITIENEESIIKSNKHHAYHN